MDVTYRVKRDVILGPPTEGEPNIMYLRAGQEIEVKRIIRIGGCVLVWPRWGPSFQIEPCDLEEVKGAKS